MGQGQQDDIVPGQGGRLRGDEGAIGQGRQVRLVFGEHRTGAVAGAQRADPHLRVGEQQSQELTTGVATGTGHGHRERHLHIVALIRNSLQAHPHA